MSQFRIEKRVYDVAEDWHVNWFNKWLRLSNLRYKYPESFCRYWRIVTVEWFVIWMITASVVKGAFRPFTLVAPLFWVGLIGAIAKVDTQLSPHNILWAMIITGVFSFAGVISSGILIEQDNDLKEANYLSKMALLMIGPIVLIIFIIMAVVMLFDEVIVENIHAGNILSYRLRIGRISLYQAWVLCVIALSVALTAWLALYQLAILIAITKVVIGTCLIIATVYIAVKLFGALFRWVRGTKTGYTIEQRILDKAKKRVERTEDDIRQRQGNTTSTWRYRFYRRISSTLKLIGDFIKYQKARICPPVFFKND